MAPRAALASAAVLLIAGSASALQLPPPSTTTGASRRAVLQGASAAALAGTIVAPVRAAEVVKKFSKTEGGVVYFDLKEGNGYSPKPGDFVIVTYKGYLSNGKLFDSSEAPGKGPKAAKYLANPPQMLKGWEEALETMREGGTRVIQVPAALAYGAAGVCPGEGDCLVPPNEKLQFELTLKRVALPPP